MTKWNTLNVNLSNSKFNKLKSGKKETEKSLNISLNLIQNTNDEAFHVNYY